MNRTFVKTYGQPLLLLFGVLAGALCGAVFGPDASVVKPVGELFLNMMFVLVVPLVFFSVSSSICSLTAQKSVGKVLGWSIAVFLGMAIVAGIIAWISTEIVNPLGDFSTDLSGSVPEESLQEQNWSNAVVSMFTVNDFPKLFSKSNLLPLIVFSALFGSSVALAKEKGRTVADLLSGGMQVIMKFVEILMYAAPLCLGCYFADLIGSLGGMILTGYLRSLSVYVVDTLIIFIVIYSLYALAFGGFKGFGTYWKNVFEPSVTAISTCSSAATIPSSISAVKKMGVDESIAETVIPLGVNIHKDGSVVGSLVRMVFTITFFGLTGYNCFEIIGISILTSLVVGAIPVGGMTAEILVCSILGVDPQFAATLLVFSTIIDIPATLLNVVGNVSAAFITDRLCRRGKA